jgi:3-methylfumaryl-CoA hydratase
MTATNVRDAKFRDTALLKQLPELAGWQPSIVEVKGTIDARTASMLAAIFDQPPMREGDELPPAWHWAFFIEPALQREIGADGHPKKGGFLPPINLPRRMFAGSSIQFNEPLVVGGGYARASEVISIEMKEGRSGKLAFVKVRHAISDERGTVCLTEEQDIVYREPDGVAKKSASTPKEAEVWTWMREVIADPVMLFRYSAVTFNGHRIHYDHPYVTQEEGYPDLVVHGPLLATLMLESLREKLPAARVTAFRFAGKGPVFARRKFHAAGKIKPENNIAELAILSGGQTAMTGQATLRPNS